MGMHEIKPHPLPANTYSNQCTLLTLNASVTMTSVTNHAQSFSLAYFSDYVSSFLQL